MRCFYIIILILWKTQKNSVKIIIIVTVIRYVIYAVIKSSIIARSAQRAVYIKYARCAFYEPKVDRYLHILERNMTAKNYKIRISQLYYNMYTMYIIYIIVLQSRAYLSRVIIIIIITILHFGHIGGGGEKKKKTVMGLRLRANGKLIQFVARSTNGLD